MELNDNGEISFPDSADAAPADGPGSLSGLLGQLLGIDEHEAPRQHVPGGLLMTIAGRVGSVELPSSREDGFRSALLRFADEDPGVLLRVFDRIVTARKFDADANTQSAGSASKVRRGPERRRQPAAVAALRRAVRDLERQTFETRAVNTRARVAPVDLGSRHLGLAVAAAAGLALVVSVATLITGVTSRPVPTYRAPLITEMAMPPAVVQPAETPKSVDRTPTKRQATRTESAAVLRSPRTRATRPKPPANPAHVTFAGGSRAITWAHPTR
jgi:hypothetical protein